MPPDWRNLFGRLSSKHGFLLVALVCSGVTAGVSSWRANPFAPTPRVEIDAGFVDALCRERGWFFTPTAKIPDSAGQYGAFYLSDHPARWEQLTSLHRHPDCASLWRGVVLVHVASEAEATADWGEYGRVVGKVVLFGDPAMVRIVANALGD